MKFSSFTFKSKLLVNSVKKFKEDFRKFVKNWFLIYTQFYIFSEFKASQDCRVFINS